MTKRERQQLEKAITHLMSDDPDGFTDGMDILLAMVGKKPFPKEGKVNPVWELNITQAQRGQGRGCRTSDEGVGNENHIQRLTNQSI